MEVSEAQEVKQLREENARLKKLVAELSLDKDMLQSVIRKGSVICRGSRYPPPDERTFGHGEADDHSRYNAMVAG